MLLAAYLSIDRVTLSKVFEPILMRFPTLSSAVVWNAVELLQEEEKSAAEVAAFTRIDVQVIELIKRCLEAGENLSK